MRSGLLHKTARYFFFAALLVAPWFYGGTTATSIVVINWLLVAALLLWAAELIVRRSWPKQPKLLLFLMVALLAIGTWMTINARSVYDAEFGMFASIDNLAPRAPGSFDYALSAACMIRVALLLMSILLVVDLVKSDRSLLQLWAVIAISGGSIALLGLLQKATGAQTIFWGTPMAYSTSNFFGPYYYHANAGAYLNLVLPFTAGFAVRAFGKPSGSGVRALGLTLFLLNLAAVAANTSRAAQLIAGFIVIALLIRFGPRLARGLSRSEINVALAGTAAVLLVMYAIGKSSHLEQPLLRWEKLGENVSADARWSASRVALYALPETGALGMGPGTFRAVFPAFNKAAEHPVGGEWRFLHQDYLQSAIEWGWLGSALWALLFFGGIFVAINNVRKPQAREWSWRRRVILQMSILALSGVALHALVDFPLQIESIQLYVAASIGLCWGSASWKR